MNAFLKKYNCKPSTASKDAVLSSCNFECFYYSSPFYLKNPLSLYEFFISELSTLNNIKVVGLNCIDDFKKHDKKRSFLLLRHDIDHDLITAIEMSKIEKKFGVSSCYFLHHLAPYYGFFDSDLAFNRHEQMVDCYLDLERNGAEVGLHIDPFSVYKHGIDGTEAVVTEVMWLRKIGLNISSTSAHGSAPYYGAENFEIFKEWCLYPRSILYNDLEIPLGQLFAEELGLKQEANFAVPYRDVNWFKVRQYLEEAKNDDLEKHLAYYLKDNPYCSWGFDYSLWLYGRDKWVIASTLGGKNDIFKSNVSTYDIIEFLKTCHNKSIVLHIHPVYLGYRLYPELGPLKNCINNLEDLDKVIMTWKKKTAILEKECFQLQEKIKLLENESISLKEVLENSRMHLKYHTRKLVK